MGFYLRKSFSALLKTYPFILARLVLYSFFAMFGFIIFFLAFYLQGFFPQIERIYFFVLGLLVFMLYWWAFRRYFLFMLKTMHIAVLSEIMKNQEIPSIKAQLSFGLLRTRVRFGSFSGAGRVESEVNKTLLELEKSIFRAKFSCPKIIKKLFSHGFLLFKNAVSFLGETVMAYIFLSDDLGPWTGAREGIVLFVQKHRTLFSRSTLLVFLGYLFFALLFFLSLLYLLPLAEEFFSFGRELSLLVLFLLDLVIYAIFVPPVILALLTWNYFKEVEALEPREDLRNYVLKAVPGFKKILDRAEIKEPTISLKEKGFIETWRAKPKELKGEILLTDEFREHLEFAKKKRKEKIKEVRTQKRANVAEDQFASISSAAKEIPEEEGPSEPKEMYRLMEKSEKAVEKITKKKEELAKIIPRPEDLKKKKTLRAFNFFLTQLVEQAGRGNEIEIMNFRSVGKGWEATTRINGDPYLFKLAVNGAIIEFKELE